MTDYVDGKAAWLAEGLPAEGDVGDDERIGSRVGRVPGDVLREPGDPLTVRANELVRDVADRLRHGGEDVSGVVFVTTPKGRLLGSVEKAALLG